MKEASLWGDRMQRNQKSPSSEGRSFAADLVATEILLHILRAFRLRPEFFLLQFYSPEFFPPRLSCLPGQLPPVHRLGLRDDA